MFRFLCYLFLGIGISVALSKNVKAAIFLRFLGFLFLGVGVLIALFAIVNTAVFSISGSAIVVFSTVDGFTQTISQRVTGTSANILLFGSAPCVVISSFFLFISGFWKSESGSEQKEEEKRK